MDKGGFPINNIMIIPIKLVIIKVIIESIIVIRFIVIVIVNNIIITIIIIQAILIIIFVIITKLRIINIIQLELHKIMETLNLESLVLLGQQCFIKFYVSIISSFFS